MFECDLCGETDCNCDEKMDNKMRTEKEFLIWVKI